MERLHHLAIGRAGADHHAQSRAPDQNVKAVQDDATRGILHTAVDGIGKRIGQRNPMRIEGPGDTDSMHVIAPDHAAQFLDDEDQPVGQQDLLGEGDQADTAAGSAATPAARRARRTTRPPAGMASHRLPRCMDSDHAQIRPDHVEMAMGQIDDAHDAGSVSISPRTNSSPYLDCVQKVCIRNVQIHLRLYTQHGGTENTGGHGENQKERCEIDWRDSTCIHAADLPFIYLLLFLCALRVLRASVLGVDLGCSPGGRGSSRAFQATPMTLLSKKATTRSSASPGKPSKIPPAVAS